MAPEILKGEQHDQSVDIWAIGILLYELFHNKEPFSGNSPKAVLAKILNFDIKYDSHFPHSAKGLVLKILKLDRRSRPDLRQIISDPFLRGMGNGSIPKPGNENPIRTEGGSSNNMEIGNKYGLRASHNVKPINSFEKPSNLSSKNVYHQSLYRKAQTPRTDY